MEAADLSVLVQVPHVLRQPKSRTSLPACSKWQRDVGSSPTQAQSFRILSLDLRMKPGISSQIGGNKGFSACFACSGGGRGGWGWGWGWDWRWGWGWGSCSGRTCGCRLLPITPLSVKAHNDNDDKNKNSNNTNLRTCCGMASRFMVVPSVFQRYLRQGLCVCVSATFWRLIFIIRKKSPSSVRIFFVRRAFCQFCPTWWSDETGILLYQIGTSDPKTVFTDIRCIFPTEDIRYDITKIPFGTIVFIRTEPFRIPMINSYYEGWVPYIEMPDLIFCWAKKGAKPNLYNSFGWFEKENWNESQFVMTSENNVFRGAYLRHLSFTKKKKAEIVVPTRIKICYL